MAVAATEAGVRRVVRTIEGEPASDGAGVRLNRLLGTASLSELDPFLLLDEFRSDRAADYLAGFPDHPHRGFETVTYMLAGRMRHADNRGNAGLLGPGSVQWMTAGRGIVHSEMPEQENGLMWGFQLWINLPAREKMTEPRYQDIEPARIPTVEAEGSARVKVIAGRLGEVAGPVSAPATDPIYLDIALPARARFETKLPAGHSAMAYVFEGAARITDTTVARGRLAVLGAGTGFAVEAVAEPARLLLLAGKPLREPIARYGPFVMNSREEILAAFADYEAGRL